MACALLHACRPAGCVVRARGACTGLRGLTARTTLPTRSPALCAAAQVNPAPVDTRAGEHGEGMLAVAYAEHGNSSVLSYGTYPRQVTKALRNGAMA